MASLLYPKHSFNLSDEEIVIRWSENIVWQYFSGTAYYEHRLPCDANQIGRFRRALGEKGLKLSLRATIDMAAAIKPKDLERVIKRQRTILGIFMREVQRKMQTGELACEHPKAISDLVMWLERAERIRTQQRQDKGKLYALHAPEVECIGKGKARKPYEFGVKSAVVVSHKYALMVGARTFPGNPYDGHILSAVLEQASNFMQDVGTTLKHIVVDLGFRGVDANNPGMTIIHRGKFKSLNATERRWLKRRQAVEPAIGHLKADHRMDKCWLKGEMADALDTLSCAAGYNLR
jgi:IS5 family transposase